MGVPDQAGCDEVCLKPRNIVHLACQRDQAELPSLGRPLHLNRPRDVDHDPADRHVKGVEVDVTSLQPGHLPDSQADREHQLDRERIRRRAPFSRSHNTAHLLGGEYPRPVALREPDPGASRGDRVRRDLLVLDCLLQHPVKDRTDLLAGGSTHPGPLQIGQE